MSVKNGKIFFEAIIADHSSNMVADGSRSTVGYDHLLADEPFEPAFAIRVGQGYTYIGKAHNGFLPFTFGDEVLFWRIWYEPDTINAGFIVEDNEYYIKIWNAYLDQTAEISDVQVTAEDGTTLTYDSLPITIGYFGDYWMTLTVLGEGPPLQDTTYTITVNSVDYGTYTEGIRVVAMPWEPDWDSKINIEMHFNTAIERNKYFVEQRRPLRYIPYYKFAFRIKAEGLSAQKLKQTMTYGHDKVFGVPVFSEHAYPSQDFTASATINTSNDLSYNWHLNNLAEYIMVVDHTTLDSEIKEIQSVSANSIVCDLPVSAGFTWQNCIVYPIVICYAEGISIAPETDTIFVGDVRLTQYEKATEG